MEVATHTAVGACDQNLCNPKTLAHTREGGRQIEPSMAGEWQRDDQRTLVQPRRALSRAGRRRERRSSVHSCLTITETATYDESPAIAAGGGSRVVASDSSNS